MSREAECVFPVVARGRANDNANAILRAAGARSSRGASTRRATHGHDPDVERIARGHERMTFSTMR